MNFYLKGVNQNYGPFTSDELKTKFIVQQTLVREENSETWNEAQDIIELNGHFSDTVNPTEQAMHWGDFKADSCSGDGLRQYSAILWDIPWGQDWEASCWEMPATINGIYFPRPERCPKNSNQWGEFDMPDSSCRVVPPSPSEKVAPCLIRTINTNALKQNDNKYDIEIQVDIYRTQLDWQTYCSAKQPFYTDPNNTVRAKLLSYDKNGNSINGDWYFIHPLQGKIPYRNINHVDVPYIVTPSFSRVSVELHFRPVPYRAGEIVFGIWLNVNGKDILFSESIKFPVRNGIIIKSGSIPQ